MMRLYQGRLKNSFFKLTCMQFSRYNLGLYYLCPMGLSGLEPPTSRLSGVRSNQLSYKPIFRKQRLTGIFSQLNSCFAFVKVREAPRTKFMLRFTARIH